MVVKEEECFTQTHTRTLTATLWVGGCRVGGGGVGGGGGGQRTKANA